MFGQIFPQFRIVLQEGVSNDVYLGAITDMNKCVDSVLRDFPPIGMLNTSYVEIRGCMEMVTATLMHQYPSILHFTSEESIIRRALICCTSAVSTLGPFIQVFQPGDHNYHCMYMQRATGLTPPHILLFSSLKTLGNGFESVIPAIKEALRTELDTREIGGLCEPLVHSLLTE